ncbi:MAG: cytochrome c3 family protein [Burkholderiaceae bacterium]
MKATGEPRSFLTGLLRLACCMVLVLPLLGQAQQRNVKAAADDCKSCHAGKSMLPAAHPATRGMVLKDCRDCHGAAAKPLAGTMPLAHTHALASVKCAACHGQEKPRKGVAPTPEACAVCHANSEQLANRINLTNAKVHGSHMGDLACDLCHKAHAASENFCFQCHDWKYVVP